MGRCFLGKYTHAWYMILINKEIEKGTMYMNGIFSKMFFILTPTLLPLCSNAQTWVFEILWTQRPFLILLHWPWMLSTYFSFESILFALSKPTELSHVPDVQQWQWPIWSGPQEARYFWPTKSWQIIAYYRGIFLFIFT